MVKEVLKKWGKIEKVGYRYVQKNLTFIAPKAYLNILFEPIEDYFKLLENKYGKRIYPKRYVQFMKETNGCKLFSNSFVIYGIVKYNDEVTPVDINGVNLNLSLYGVKDCFSFGNIGGKYELCFKDDSEKVYVLEKEKDKYNLIKELDSVDYIFDVVLNNLIEEYDSEGHKIHFKKEFKDMPLVVNLSDELNLFEKEKRN